jgi:hypothetical protein
MDETGCFASDTACFIHETAYQSYDRVLWYILIHEDEGDRLSGEIFRLSEIAATERVPTSVDRDRQTVKARRFLKGPIPWPWIEAAARLPGKALAVGLVLWRETGMDGSGPVRLTTAKLAGLGFDRAGKMRALRGLEAAGLVHVERNGRHTPLVRIVVAGPSGQLTNRDGADA